MESRPPHDVPNEFVLEGSNADETQRRAARGRDSRPAREPGHARLPEECASKGLWLPMGLEVKTMQCWRCKAYGHRTGDRECPLNQTGNVDLEASRIAREDPMAMALAKRPREEASSLRALVEDVRRDERKRKKRRKKEKKKKRKRKKEKKRKRRRRRSSSSSVVRRRRRRRRRGSRNCVTVFDIPRGAGPSRVSRKT